MGHIAHLEADTFSVLAKNTCNNATLAVVKYHGDKISKSSYYHKRRFILNTDTHCVLLIDEVDNENMVLYKSKLIQKCMQMYNDLTKHIDSGKLVLRKSKYSETMSYSKPLNEFYKERRKRESNI